MKKQILTCFLGGLCLIGSDIRASSKVVESPVADFLYRAAPFGMGLSPYHPFSEGFSLVDSTRSQRQEGIRSSASSGTLIYGELINPDSLGPLRVVFSPYKKELGQTLPDSTLEVSTTHGTFFDGVLDPRVRKFRVRLPEFTENAYFSLYLDDRPLIEEFLVSPYDSMMVGIDLKRAAMVFAGPAGKFMETQYLLYRAREEHRFASPRNLVERDRETYLDTKDYRSQLKKANQEFGARLRILELMKDHVYLELGKLTMPVDAIPGWKILESRKDLLTPAQYLMLREDLLGTHYATAISSIRRYGYLVAKGQKNQDAVDRIEAEMPEVLSSLKKRMTNLAANQLTGGGAYFYKEWAKFNAALQNQDYTDLVLAEFKGETKDLLLYAYAMELVSRQEDPVRFLADITDLMDQSSYRSELKEMEDRLAPQIPIHFAEFTDLKGERVDTDDLKGKPTLLYFYFSTCTHSANFFQRVLKPIYQSGLGDMQLIAVSVDNDPDLWKTQLSTYSDPSLTNLRLPSKTWRGWLDHYLITGYPRTMLLDEDGKIISIWVPGRTEDAFRSSLNSLLGSQEPAITTPKPSKL